MDVIRTAKDGDATILIFWCPGCLEYHGVWVGAPNPATGGRWTWNGRKDRPTFSPSILVHWSDGRPRCHSYVEDGTIRFLGDCQHRLAGQSLPLAPDQLECGL